MKNLEIKTNAVLGAPFYNIQKNQQEISNKIKADSVQKPGATVAYDSPCLVIIVKENGFSYIHIFYMQISS